MGLVAIQEQNLIDIGDALRRKHGETKVIYSEEIVPVVKVSKTPNTISLTEYDSEMPYANRGAGITDTITIEGATKLRVIMAYQTFSIYSDDYVSITEGTVPNTSYNYKHRYYGKELNTVELAFNGDTITFYLRTLDADEDRKCFGYYAEVRGYDADGNIITDIEGEKVIKNGFRAQDMASAIDSLDISGVPTDEELTIGGNCTYKFAFEGWNWFINKYKNKITTKNITNAERMFTGNSYLTEIPFDINFINTDTGINLNAMFYGVALKKLPTLYIPNAIKINLTGFLQAVNYVRDLNGLFANEETFGEQWQGYVNTAQFGNHYCGALFNGCSSLRTVPTWFYKLKLNPNSTSYIYNSYSIYYRTFYSCAFLDEAKNIPVWNITVPQTSNMFDNMAYDCKRLSDFTFETNADGSPIVVQWKNQTIPLNTNVGYGSQYGFYNSGITTATKVTDDATYQALKNNPDWYTEDKNYSRYNHDSALRTIQSLPDTSVYLASAGGTNTIKFVGVAGAKTDGGAINALTAEELAIASNKGWTVTLT